MVYDMPRKSFEINVNPEVVIWARESIGRNVQEVANRLGVSTELVRRWETGNKKPTLVQVKTLATYYKRPLAVFFLPEPPDEPPLPKDFRTLPGEEKLPLSPQTRLAFRKARRLQSLAYEMEDFSQYNYLKCLENARTSDNPERLANKIREKLGISIDKQSGWANEKEAFAEWRRVIENQSIFVIQMPMPLEEARAFSLSDEEVPIIILNTKDTSYRARSFSLLHELGHLLLKIGGVCIPEKGANWELNRNRDSGVIKEIEIFCNSFAGAVLVPKKPLLELELIKDVNIPIIWDERTLGGIANTFWVSKEVILRRLLIFKKTTNDFYELKHKEWSERNRARQKGGGGRRKHPIECIHKNGIPFASLVVNSYKRDKITYSDVADYLDIKVKHIPKVERLLEAGA